MPDISVREIKQMPGSLHRRVGSVNQGLPELMKFSSEFLRTLPPEFRELAAVTNSVTNAAHAPVASEAKPFVAFHERNSDNGYTEPVRNFSAHKHTPRGFHT